MIQNRKRLANVSEGSNLLVCDLRSVSLVLTLGTTNHHRISSLKSEVKAGLRLIKLSVATYNY